MQQRLYKIMYCGDQGVYVIVDEAPDSDRIVDKMQFKTPREARQYAQSKGYRLVKPRRA